MSNPFRDEQTTAAEPLMPRVLSAVQPTGALHLGNYLGALRQWVPLQTTHEVFCCIADLHSLTSKRHDPKVLAADTLTTAMLYMAVGIDPDQSPIFVQSHVPAHSELAWLLTCVTPVNWLERMTQYKQKADEATSTDTGLLTYPVLMASDILLYRPQFVPVGADQLQHLELTRKIAARFNHKYGATFNEPDAMVVGTGARVMSLTRGTEKMSKSGLDASRINLLDTPDELSRKIRRATSDQTETIYAAADRPEATNLLNLYQMVSGLSQEQAAAEGLTLNWGAFKARLRDALVAYLAPIQERHAQLAADPAHVRAYLGSGAAQAQAVANGTLKTVREHLGHLSI